MDYLLLPFVELEVRFGTQTEKYFDSSIDKNYFEKIKNVLDTGDFVIHEIETEEYIKDNLKLSNQSIQLKENVFTKKITTNFAFDFKLSVNQEFNLNSYLNSFSKENCIIRNKKRRSYISHNFKYDLTSVIQKEDGINKSKYELEIELLVNKETLLWNNDFINIFLECKMYDIINIVEPMSREDFKINLF